MGRQNEPERNRIAWKRVKVGEAGTALHELLERQPLTNVYPLGGLEHGQVGAAPVEFFVGYRGSRLTGAVMLARDLNLTYACAYVDDLAENSFDHFPIERLGISLVIGRADEIEVLEQRIPGRLFRRADRYAFVEIHPEDYHPGEPGLARWAGPADIGKLVDVYEKYPLDGYKGKENICRSIQGFMRGTGYVLVEQDEKIVAVYRVITETRRAGLVGGSFTLPEYRRQGYNTMAHNLLYPELFKRGIIPVAIHSEENEPVRKMMATIGGRVTGTWKILRLNKPKQPVLSLQKKIYSWLSRIQ